ncbi:hypothetical protein ANAPH2_00415 [Anaplasma phagocytophilum]|nr:hypothetical protein ANAPH2_00415 [Anaplasma phagocytophilum]
MYCIAGIGARVPFCGKLPVIQVCIRSKVLIVGFGGLLESIAHYLLKEGHNVAAIDGVKINPIIGTSSGIKQTRFYVAQNKTTATINTQ